MAGNMESMLLNDDSWSSDDSSENNEKPREQEPAATAGTAEPRPPAPGPTSKRRRLSSPGSAFERITPSTSARTQLPQSGSCTPPVEAQTPTKRTSRPPLLPQESFWNVTTRGANAASSTTTPRSIATPDRAKSKSELKLFTKYLLHSLAQQDPALHRRANGLIQEFNQKAASRKESPGYRNRMDEYRIQLKAIVGGAHWSRAEALTKAHLQRGEHQKNTKADQGMASTKVAQMAASSTSSDASAQVEYEERDNNLDTMVMVDHAVDYDWSSPLLGKKAEVKLTQEQTKLLYGRKPQPTTTYPFLAPGWSKRNVLNARRAWATARLRLAAQDQYVARLINRVPVVARLPSSPQLTKPPPKVPPLSPQLLWVNEQNAENDPTLALLSEATQIYLKSILQKALTIARQRENVDGIRLVHLQHGPKKPPVSLRLGCDVTRQVAQVAGNAAKTVQRMEEALGRQPNVLASDCDLSNYETLYRSSSMADLSLRPQLANAAEQADLNAKRSFEIYEGKDANGPPFGPVPKRPKILSSDVTLAHREWCEYGHQRLHFATPQIQL